MSATAFPVNGGIGENKAERGPFLNHWQVTTFLSERDLDWHGHS